MLCDFEDQGGVMRCRRPECGRFMLKVPGFDDPARYRSPCAAPSGKYPTPPQLPTGFRTYLTDSATRNNQQITVHLFSPPCQHLGIKRFFKDGSPKTAKQTGCCGGGTVTFTPTYDCAIFGKCAPFAGQIEDEFDQTHPCPGCEKYQQKNLESTSADHPQ